MHKIYPNKLEKGDEIRIIAPSRSLSIISQELRDIAKSRFDELGLRLTFGEHTEEKNNFASSSIESRVADLHSAFLDKNVKAILTVIGGHNSNQLLDSIDWELIKNNPKILCGFSDITILNNSFFAKTGLVTYSGPHYSTFGQKLHFDYTLDYFRKCLISDIPIEIQPSAQWSDDEWYKNQDNRLLEPNNGWQIINEGEASGTLLGGNLCTLNLLQGTKYMPDLYDSILFLEDDELTFPENFDRDLQSIIHQPGFEGVKSMVIGRFQKVSKVSENLLAQIIKSKKELNSLPVIANVDFGHTDPKITFPVGGDVTLKVSENEAKLVIAKH